MQAAPTVKRVAQELGGKSPNVILDDADLKAAVSAGVVSCMLNSGQTCTAPTRMLVPRAQYQMAIAIAQATAQALVVGDPASPDSKLGPSSNRAQYERVQRMIEAGIQEGARVVAAPGRPEGLVQGFYNRPTVFADVSNDMTIAREEIFGPVLSMIPYDDEAEAIRIANDTPYGLAAYVWSGDPARARRVAGELRAGSVQINGAKMDFTAPFGGYKTSGNGREFGAMAWPSSSSTSRSPLRRGCMKESADMDAFDYLVVGAGSAGCAIAARLAEDPAVTVALIEAGPSDHHISVWMPIGMASTVPKAGARNYGYYTAPQDAFNGRQGYQPRGRGLGAVRRSTAWSISAATATTTTLGALGCTGWGYEDVLPYFRRSEHHENYSGRDDNRWHGGSGPLRVSNLRSPNPFSNRFVQAAIQAGYPANGDFNGAEQDGAGLYHVTQHRGERWNTARAYLHQGNAGDKTLSGGRRNLTVLVETQVLRVDFDGARATGLTVVRGGVEQKLAARREVILSAGAFNSPQLLLASGVGPAQALRDLGIRVVADLPGVGKNLQDHPDVILNKQVRSLDLFGHSLPGFARLSMELLRYRRKRTGMPSSNFAEAGAFIRTRQGLAAPDIQLHFVPALLNHGGDRKKLGHGYSCHACVLRPKSRGEVRLRSADMREAPLIDPRFLSDEEDMAGMVAGVRAIRRIFAQQALASAGGRELFTDDFGPGEGNQQAIEAFIRERTDSVYHPVGTCKMGVDDMAVVIPRCACAVCRGCAWSTHRSCLHWWPATPTRRRS